MHFIAPDAIPVVMNFTNIKTRSVQIVIKKPNKLSINGILRYIIVLLNVSSDQIRKAWYRIEHDEFFEDNTQPHIIHLNGLLPYTVYKIQMRFHTIEDGQLSQLSYVLTNSESKLITNHISRKNTRGLFETLSSIYKGVFLRK